MSNGCASSNKFIGQHRLDKHPRFHMHFTPTSSSWLNMVERFFADLTAVVREGSFASVRQLISEIELHLAHRHPRPYKWTATGEDILAKIQRAKSTKQVGRSPGHMINSAYL